MTLFVKCTWGFLCAGLVFASVHAAEPAKGDRKTPEAPKDEIAANFEKLKKLAGDWRAADAKEDPAKGKIAVSYRVIASGSTVVETIFPGDEKEMVTVYHRDGDHLVLTHYCCCGNQPRMRSRSSKDKDELVFEFAGGANVNFNKGMHMNNCRLRFVDADHFHSEWEYFVDGKAAGKHSFELVRKK